MDASGQLAEDTKLRCTVPALVVIVTVLACGGRAIEEVDGGRASGSDSAWSQCGFPGL